MATDVTVDAHTDGLKTSGATSLSWNHTITAGLTNPWLIVCCTSATGTAVNPSSVKWDTAGVNQSLTTRTSKADGFNNCMTTIAGVSPSSSGTKQVRVTYAASVEITGGSASYQFVNQTTTYDTATTATSGTSGTSSTLNVTSSAHAMVVSCLVENDGSTLSASAGQTIIHNENVGAANHAGLSSYKQGAAGTIAMTVSGMVTGNGWGHAGVSLIFDGGGGTTFTDSVSESGSAADAVSATALLPATRSETLSAAEAPSASATLLASISETLAAADAQTGAIATPAAVSETVTGADTASAAIATPASLTETLTAAEAQSASIVAPAAITETLTAAVAQDATVVVAGASAVTETLTAADGVSATVKFAASISEAGAAAETVSASATFVAVRTESVAALDSIVATALLQGIVLDVIAATDGEAAVAFFSGTVADVLAASELVTAAGGVVQPEYPPGRFTLDDVQPRFALDEIRPTFVLADIQPRFLIDDVVPHFAIDDPQATFTLRQDYPS